MNTTEEMPQPSSITPGSPAVLREIPTYALHTDGGRWYYELVRAYNASRPQTQDAEDDATEAIAL